MCSHLDSSRMSDVLKILFGVLEIIHLIDKSKFEKIKDKNMTEFKGKVALSTGAASGMGLLFAQNIAALEVTW